MKVLAIDDEPAILDLIGEVFEASGHTAVLTASATEALSLISEDTFDAALVDYLLPGVNGVDLLERIRRRAPRCIRMLMSGHVDLPTALAAVNLGQVARVFTKPFDPFVMLEQVQSAIEAREQLETLARIRRDDIANRETCVLRECLRDERFGLVFQPLVRASDGSRFGREALLRGDHPEASTPDRILEIAAARDRLDDVADVVVRRAADAMPKLDASEVLFINMHPDEMLDESRLGRRLAKLEEWADRVVFEITEQADLLNLGVMEQRLKRISQMGFRTAVDDVGSGYNSLAVLANVAPDFLKIDISIVRNIDRNPRKRRIVQLLTSFAECVDATVVGEGVESKAEMVALKSCGVDLLQGYLFGRPGPLPAPKPDPSSPIPAS